MLFLGALFQSNYNGLSKYDGENWYIIGSSRLGDVWLSRSGESLYEKRVDIADCTEFYLWTDA